MMVDSSDDEDGEEVKDNMKSGRGKRVVTLREELSHIDAKERFKEALKFLGTVTPDGLYSTQESQEWEYIEFYVGSGATETVMSEKMLASVELKEGLARKQGVAHEVTNGDRVANLGEREFTGMTEGGGTKRIKAQVCEVNNALLSVSKAVTAGNRVVFGDDGSSLTTK